MFYVWQIFLAYWFPLVWFQLAFVVMNYLKHFFNSVFYLASVLGACCTNCSPEWKSSISLTTWFPLIYSIQHKNQCAHFPKRLLFSGKLVTRLGSKNLHFFLQTSLFVKIIPDISSSLLPWRQHDPIPYWPTTHDWECDYLMIHFHMQIWMPTFT